MNLPRYEDHEGDFLNAMATRFGFTGKNSLIFEKRFLEDNREVTHEKLVGNPKFAEKLIQGTKNGDASRIFRQQLKAICEKLETAGCPPSTGDGRWANAKRWLREVVFPQWAKEQGLVADAPVTLHPWEKLLKLATPTDKMGPKLAGVLDMVGDYQECVPLGSHIIFELKLETPGYLLLLEKGTTGRFWCLCPSVFAPQPYLGEGVVVLPQPVSGKKSFKITGQVGLEQIVAIIGKDNPSLDWLPEGSGKPLQMEEGHLNELLEYLQSSGDGKVFYTEYTVTA
ncbi:DUF4384 domain-containing protein [Argonema antarcticum]|uniref:DUF4384 domain-containing protein n=1 Tax=Argonema antarcticum TaxID=2942763 RepID=UPI00201156B6|nr:DUF4384 domain-containing protein [Argonema antarcticum]MCL1470504.1 DUF4384 domain-containing protein [Argonema antarcticum A004/B2]